MGSLDVDSLYPSLDIDRCARVVREKLDESGIQFEKLQWKEITMYLRYHMKQSEIDECDFSQYLPIRRFHKRPPLFVHSGSMDEVEIRHHPWIFLALEPDANTLRRMFCRVIEVMIIRTMGLHDYLYDGQIYRQKCGGSIGLDLTGVVSDIYMCEWDKELICKIEGNSMRVQSYKRYKDDVDLIIEERRLGEPTED